MRAKRTSSPGSGGPAPVTSSDSRSRCSPASRGKNSRRPTGALTPPRWRGRGAGRGGRGARGAGGGGGGGGGGGRVAPPRGGGQRAGRAESTRRRIVVTASV